MAKKSGFFEIELAGFEELSKAFNILPEKVQKRMIGPSLKEGAEIIETASKLLSPRLTGKNIEFIHLKKLKPRGKLSGWSIQTGTRSELGIARNEKYYYPAVLEFGSKHVDSKPFMRPALEQNRDKAIKAVAELLEKKMKSFAKRQAKLAAKAVKR